MKVLAVTKTGHVRIGGHTGGALGAPFGGTDVWVADYDKAGQQLWLTQFGTAGSDAIDDVVLAKDGTLYALGDTNGHFPNVANAGSYHLFVARISPTGTLVSVRQFGTSEYDEGCSVVLRKSAANGGALVVGFDTEGVVLGHQALGSYDLGLVALPAA